MARKATIAILASTATALIVWDIYAYLQPGNGTISAVVLDWARAHPVFGWACGVVCGHLFWPQKDGGEKVTT